MASLASVILVAPHARPVVLFEGARLLRVLGSIAVAAIAVVLTVALRTAKTVSRDMFFVPEQHFGHRSVHACCLVQFFFRRRDRRVHPTHDVIWRRQVGRRSLSGFRLVAHAAALFAAPFPVAAQTLAMIRAFESRLADVAPLGANFVTALARRVLQPLRSVVVTNGASTGHLGHICVTPMIKRHGKIHVLELVQNHDFWPGLGIKLPDHWFGLTA